MVLQLVTFLQPAPSVLSGFELLAVKGITVCMTGNDSKGEKVALKAKIFGADCVLCSDIGYQFYMYIEIRDI